MVFVFFTIFSLNKRQNGSATEAPPQGPCMIITKTVKLRINMFEKRKVMTNYFLK